MKVKVGQFARLKRGYICEIININDFREPNMKYGVEASYLKDIMFIGDDDISKASHNIIDLIEVGDYVNGEQVRYIEEDTDYRVLAIDEDYTYIIAGYDCDGFTRPIKSIVTKEQFESIEYSLEG